MSWVSVDDNAPDHRKLVEVGPIAAWLWLCGLCYCNRQPARDGFIPTGKVPALYKLPSPMKHAGILVRARLWVRVKGGFRVHDYHHYQPNAEKVDANRKRVSEARAKAGRIGGLRSGQSRSETKQLLEANGSNCFPANEADASSNCFTKTKQNEAPSPPLPRRDLNTDDLMPTPAGRRAVAGGATP